MLDVSARQNLVCFYMTYFMILLVDVIIHYLAPIWNELCLTKYKLSNVYIPRLNVTCALCTLERVFKLRSDQF